MEKKYFDLGFENMKENLKNIIIKNKFLLVILLIINNYFQGFKLKLKNISTSSTGITHTKKKLNESINYIKSVFDDYIKYGNLDFNRIKGKKILEIGPGDNFGVALLFLAYGAKKVVLLDKYYAKRDDIQHIKIYKKLIDGLTVEQKDRVKSAINIANNKIKINKNKIELIYGISIEKFNYPIKFDLIISRAVLMLVYHVDEAFKKLDRLTVKRSKQIHKIDFRDLNIFSTYSHPLTFLTIPSIIWNQMSYFSNLPNRKLINYYKKKMIELNYNYKIYITHIGNKKEFKPHKLEIIKNKDYNESDINVIEIIRPKLSKEFKKLSDKELLISGIFLVAEKM